MWTFAFSSMTATNTYFGLGLVKFKCLTQEGACDNITDKVVFLIWLQKKVVPALI